MLSGREDSALSLMQSGHGDSVFSHNAERWRGQCESSATVLPEEKFCLLLLSAGNIRSTVGNLQGHCQLTLPQNRHQSPGTRALITAISPVTAPGPLHHLPLSTHLSAGEHSALSLNIHRLPEDIHHCSAPEQAPVSGTLLTPLNWSNPRGTSELSPQEQASIQGPFTVTFPQRASLIQDIGTMIESILKKKPGGDRVLSEYARTKSLTDGRRRDMVNILVAHMTSEHGNQCCEAIALMKHTTDEKVIKDKMKQTFHYRQSMVHDSKKSTDIFMVFPRFLDIMDCELQHLILNVESTSDIEEGMLDGMGYILYFASDSPSSSTSWAQETREAVSKAACDHLVKFLQTGTSIQDHLDSVKESHQPYLLACGNTKRVIHNYFIVMTNMQCHVSHRTLLLLVTNFSKHILFLVPPMMKIW
ncbi:hypothetical protein WMY93_012257 [Mugilogobius chulae]|uniref:Uncharacterized protein n=1 Tax=Mugilogobius chulae TaxID=88201 RepID=A0AAW0P868_9GOBI